MVMWPSPDKLCQKAGSPIGDPSQMDLTGLVMEPKLDGFRLLVHIDTSVTAYTRTGKPQTGKIPHIEAALSHLPAGTWLDGELVYFDDKGFPEWGQVQSCMGSNAGDPTGKLTYVVFDILAFNGLDIRPLPLSERRQALELVFAIVQHPNIQLSEQVPATHEYHEDLIAKGMEGTIVKDPTKPYASGKRGHGWTKFKMNDEMDVVIIGFKPGENSFTGMIGAIEFGQYKEQDWCGSCSNDPAGQRWLCPNRPHAMILTPRGRCSGMDMKMRQWFTDHQNESIGTVISMAYMGIMPTGSPRHPQWKRNRADKSASECEWT